MNDVLCQNIGRGRFPAKYKVNGTRRAQSALNLQILVDHIKRIHLLSLVLMNALDLQVKDSVGQKFHAFSLQNI